MRVGDDQTFLAAWVENTGSPLCVDVDTFRYSSSDGSVAAVCEAGSCTTTTWDDHSPAWFSHVTAVGAGGPATITSEALILGAIPVCSDDEQITVFQPSCSLTFTALPVMSVGQILPLQVSAGVPVGGDVNCGSGGSGITVSEVGSSGAITILPPNPACEPSYSVDIRADAPGTAIVEATATMDDGITACSPVPNLAISVTYADWFQVQGSDVGSDGGFVSVIPITAPLRYLIRDGAVSDITLVREHGVLSYANASPPDLGTGTVSDTSTQDWLANSAYAGTTYDYAYFKSKLDENIFDPNINDSDMRAGDWSGGDNYGGFEWFFYNAASLGALEINENIDFGNRKVILFVSD